MRHLFYKVRDGHKLWTMYCVSYSWFIYNFFLLSLLIYHFLIESSFCSFVLSYLFWFHHVYAAERRSPFKAWREDATRPVSQGCIWLPSEHNKNTYMCEALNLAWHFTCFYTWVSIMQLLWLVWQRFPFRYFFFVFPCFELGKGKDKWLEYTDSCSYLF